VAFPAQRLKIEIVISTAMSFWNDVVNAGRLFCNLLPAMILTQVLITLKDTRPFNFPGPPISTFLSALTCLIIPPTVTGMPLSVLITIATGIVGNCRTALVPAWTLCSCWHRHYPVYLIQT
jgi:hypothetical protein